MTRQQAKFGIFKGDELLEGGFFSRAAAEDELHNDSSYRNNNELKILQVCAKHPVSAYNACKQCRP